MLHYKERPIPVIIWDLFTAFDSIEHLTKEEGNILIGTALANFCKLIIFTPSGFLRQDETTHPELLKTNPWQLHKSGWTEQEFIDLGFKTILLKDFHEPQGLPNKFDAIIAYMEIE